MLIWPIILLSFALIGYVIYTYISMERTQIMADWPSNRCGVFVMFAASYFKPDSDPRTPGEFSTDNIRFCMGELSKAAMSAALAPYNLLLNQQSDNLNDNNTALNSLREVSKTMMDAFMSFIEPFFKRFKNVSYQVGAIVQHLKMAIGRVNAAITSLIYTGLSMVTGLQNMIQFILIVIMIILAILIALLIILFFVLFPFIPILITPVIVLIIGFAAAGLAGAEMASNASGMQGSFCFAPNTPVRMVSGTSKPIADIQIGDVLEGHITVEGILRMDGTTSDLYDLEGIHVSGSHLVFHKATGKWHSVSEDSRAIPSIKRESVLYCLNTSNRQIPIQTQQGNTLLFRDWEEIDDDDAVGQKGWDRLVAHILRMSVSESTNDTFCLMDGANRVPTEQGLKSLDAVKLGDILQFNYNNSTKVIGIVEGRVKGTGSKGWLSACIERAYTTDGSPYHRISTLEDGDDSLIGRHLITDSGEFIVNINGITKRVRDFTEVGADNIHLTYPFVLERINKTFKPSGTTE